MTSHDSIHQIVLNLLRHLARWLFCRFNCQGNVLFYSKKLFLENILAIQGKILQVFEVLFLNSEHNRCCARNRIAHISTCPADQSSLIVDDCLTNEASHQLVGICPSLVDFQPAVAATQILQTYLYGNIIGIRFHLFIFKGSCDVHSTGTTYHELAHRLIVDIKQDVSLQGIGSQVIHAVHAGFLVSRDQSLQRSMFQVLALEHCHDGSHTHTIVTTQRSTFCLHPFAINPCVDGISLEIMVALVHFLRDHIHVRLQDSHLAVLVTWSGRFAHHDVLSLILESLDTMFLCPAKQESLDLLQMSAGTWHLSQEIKVLPNNLWI